MANPAPFQIFDASAGSGKTYTLVKEYLKLLLNNPQPGYYKHILAITFTNKAVAEMKQRIINSLVAFADESSISNPPALLLDLATETELSISDLSSRAADTLQHILHHYALFSVETIDHFNHRLLRTFAKDLKLPPHFTVHLETQELLQEAVDALIERSGSDPDITRVLLDFAIQKADDDASWDIARDIRQTASLLASENHTTHIASLSEIPLTQFEALKRELHKERLERIQIVTSEANQILDVLSEHGLTESEFTGGYLPKFFEKLSLGNLSVEFDRKWQLSLGEVNPYPKRVSEDVAVRIDQIIPQLVAAFNSTKTHVQRITFLEAVLKNVTPLSVLHLVNSEIETIKEEQSLVPISQFNTLIYEELKDQPAPYIYERLGERYRHFFIDEFQDTSGLQWSNLYPLIDNALSQEYQEDRSGSLLLVGDAKQAIYRWRGGDPSIFLDISNSPRKNKVVHKLGYNFRSGKAIVSFTNAFFSYASERVKSPTYSKLLASGSSQESILEFEGYVSMDFGAPSVKEEADIFYSEKVLQIINEVKLAGYTEGDICLLTRTRKEGIVLSTYLLEKGVSVVSSETQLLSQSPLVRCLVQLLEWSLFPNRKELLVQILLFLHGHVRSAEAKHSFIASGLSTNPQLFSEWLEAEGINISFETMGAMTLYESLEYLIASLGLETKMDAYVLGLMDMAHEFTGQQNSGKLQFLEHWEKVRDKEAIASTQSNAVQVMTIHKAKGLEFKIVICPYTDVQLQDDRNNYIWYPLEQPVSGFDALLLKATKKVHEWGEVGALLHDERSQVLEMDSINLLYVALTRASERLYILSKKPGRTFKSEPKSYNDLLAGFLEETGSWDETVSMYEFGVKEKAQKSKSETGEKRQIPLSYVSVASQNRIVVNNQDSDESREEAQQLGSYLHTFMSFIKDNNDFEEASEFFTVRSGLTSEKIEKVKDWVKHIITNKALAHLFDGNGTVYNERDLIGSKGELLRPDRINFWQDGSITISDYKTGDPRSSDQQQIEQYSIALEQMGFPVKEKLLIYINGDHIMVNKT